MLHWCIRFLPRIRYAIYLSTSACCIMFCSAYSTTSDICRPLPYISLFHGNSKSPFAYIGCAPLLAAQKATMVRAITSLQVSLCLHQNQKNFRSHQFQYRHALLRKYSFGTIQRLLRMILADFALAASRHTDELSLARCITGESLPMRNKSSASNVKILQLGMLTW